MTFFQIRSFRFFENDKITKIVKIRTEELGDETPFVRVILIVDFEYDVGNLTISCKYYKKDL